VRIFFRTFLLVFLSICFAPHSVAQQGMTETRSSSGRGYSIAGSILTPVAASVGGTLLFYGVLESGACKKSSTFYSRRDCERSKFNTYTGAAIVTLGVGTGVYLTVKGRRARHATESSEKLDARPSEIVLHTSWLL